MHLVFCSLEELLDTAEEAVVDMTNADFLALAGMGCGSSSRKFSSEELDNINEVPFDREPVVAWKQL